MLRKTLLVASVAVATAWAVPASADTILFNPAGTGAGTALSINTLDQNVGNGLAVGITTQVQPAQFTFLYQANLNSANVVSGPNFANGTSGEFFTFTAAFTETVTGVFLTSTGLELDFGLNPAGTNNFTMYASNAAGNDLAGTGFNTGTAILSGQAVTTDFGDNFTFTCSNHTSIATCQNSLTTQQLDQSGNNDWPGITSNVGNGFANIDVHVTSFNSGYFPSFNLATIFALALTNTTEHLPYNQVDPSRLFNGSPSNVGTVNGTSGPNTLLQADASTSFQLTPVPEPATLTLMGFGLLSAAGARRRQKRQAAK